MTNKSLPFVTVCLLFGTVWAFAGEPSLNMAHGKPRAATAVSTPRIIHLSDLHFSDSPRTLDSGYLVDSQNSSLRSAVLSDYLVNNKATLRADRIVITGDVTDSGDAGDYLIAQAFIAKLKKNGFEVHCVPGNHDYSKEGTLMLGQRESGQDGTRQRNFAKLVDDSTFPRFIDLQDGWLILLDSMQGEMAIPGRDNCGQGLLGAAQLAELRAQLDRVQADRRAGKKVIVCLHHSPFKLTEGDLPDDGSMGIHSRGGLGDAKEFMSIVANKIDCLLFGHTSPDGRLQQGHGYFETQKKVYGIPMINCENLEHLPWSEELSLNASAKQVCVVPNQDGRLEVFYIGLTSDIYHDWQLVPNGDWNGETPPDGRPNRGWHGGEALGGQAMQICAGRRQDGRIEVFYAGADSKLYHNWQMTPNGAWHGETVLRTGSAGAPEDTTEQVCVISDEMDRSEAFYIGADSNIYRVWQATPDDGVYRKEVLGGQAKQICVGQNEDGRIEIFYAGMDSKICHNWQTIPGGGWHGEETLGPRLFPEQDDSAQQMCVARNRDGCLELFYVGTDGEVFHNRQTAPNGTWHGEERLAGFLQATAQQLCAGQNKDGRLEIFYAGANLFVYHNYQTGLDGRWAGEDLLRGLLDRARQICVGRNVDGRLEIFYVGVNSKLYHDYQTIPNGAYPITVIDMDKCEREVYHTDSPTPAEVTSER